MKVKFQFNSKSSGQNVPEAIALAKSLDARLENRFLVMEFDSPQDKNLQKLYQLVGGLKGSMITLDDGEPINASKFFLAVECQDKLLCKGICKHVRVGYYPIDQFLISSIPNIENGVFKTPDVENIRHLTSFLEPITENRFKFNKELFFQHAIEDTILENQFCDKFEVNSLKEEIEKLPDEIELITEEEMEFEEPDRGPSIYDFIKSCEIDNQMEMSDIIICSKAISLLTLTDILIKIHDSDVMIQSFPEIKKVILIKFNLIEVEMEDEEEEIEEVVNLVKKENGFFSIKNPLIEMYFQIYDEVDQSISEQFKLLQRL